MYVLNNIGLLVILILLYCNGKNFGSNLVVIVLFIISVENEEALASGIPHFRYL